MNKQIIEKLTTGNWKLNSILLLLCCIIAVFLLFGAPHWLNLETIKANKDSLLNYVDAHYWLMLMACGIFYTLATALSVPGGVVLSLTLGFLFGRWVGTALIVISATIGASLIFWLARYLFADWVKERLQRNITAIKLIDSFESDALNYLLFLRLVPLFPFWLVNLAPAFTPISSRTYILATFIGIIPGSFVFANLGQSLGQITSLEHLLSVEVFLAFFLLGMIALAPVLIKKFKPDLWPKK